jgi:hypothetical protein
LVPTPSDGVSSFTGVGKVIKECQSNFHTGRPARNFGPPASLFNTALGRFDYLLRHLDDDSFSDEPPASLILETHQFMVISAESYVNESTRTSVIKEVLNGIVGNQLNWTTSKTQFNVKPDALGFDGPPFFIVEVKDEAGLEGDASLQAALSYAHIATSAKDKVKSFHVLCVCHTLY